MKLDGRDILKALSEPFEDHEIEWRAQTCNQYGNALMLPYIDARAAMERLDKVLGVNWKDQYREITMNGKQAFQCELSIKIADEWVTRTDGAETTDFESVKGGYSSAFKRACVKFGIGRYLYDLPQFWLKIEKSGSVYVSVKNGGEKITGFVNPPSVLEIVTGSKPKPQSQPKQPQSQQAQQPANQNQKASSDHEKAIKAVWGQIQDGNIASNLIPYFLERVGCNSSDLKDASMEQLERIYHAISPVNTYLNVCRGYNLSLEQVLYYSQIVCKTTIADIIALYFLMDYKRTEEAIELIKGDYSKSIAQ
ncbi:Rad52/Rad22 family DNA repair protein [Lysinibacillus sp. NPDC097214]|uniref:Rad52/Rad22 family DNA repair protein n=1 Tax=Lysinibacillus sp. NPDC097214 TaxID=3390584 RepID=UPI003CFE78BA